MQKKIYKWIKNIGILLCVLFIVSFAGHLDKEHLDTEKILRQKQFQNINLTK